MNKVIIQTTKPIYPQIYAYTLPTVTDKQGWIKIGYTERQDVNVRIKEQVGTVDLSYDLLWHKKAISAKNKTFTDHQFHHYLRKYKNIKNKPNTEWFFYNGTPDKSLEDFCDFVNGKYVQEKEQLKYQLRDEQLDAVNQTLAYFNQNSNSKFLWNAKPRFGKTLTTYDLARKLNAKTVLIVTNRPAIANSWFDDFEEFIAWQTDYVFVSTNDSLKERPVFTREQFIDQLSKPDGKKSIIAFISLQDLKGSKYFGSDGKYDKLLWVKELNWDLLVIDEAHEGVDTLKTDVAFDNINRDFTLHLSGTPFKALASGEFSQDEIYNWTYADEQQAKLDWNGNGYNPYENLPQLNLFSYQMSQMISDKVNQGADIDGEHIDFAFDLNAFFETDDKGGFIHKKEVEKWLDTLSKNEKYPFSTKELRDELKHTFWLLNRVASVKALAKLLKNHPVFENYKIILAVGDGRASEDEMVGGRALDRVKDAIKNHEKTITLSVGQLTTGITIPEWAAVMMLSNVKSSALYMQTAFRAQNAWQYKKDGQIHQKQNAYVFDFALERTLIIYDEFANNLSIQTTNGAGTTGNREDNIRTLLNFFPVIAEDSDGKMVELNVNQVLTIPKAIKAQEVVKRGFMSNLLFQNISGIFSAGAGEVREILEQLNPMAESKSTQTKTSKPIDTQGIQVDNDGNAVIDNKIIIHTNNARFGEKVYATIETQTQNMIQNQDLNHKNLASELTDIITQNTQSVFKDLAKENRLTEKFAEKVVKEQSQEIAYEVQKIQKQHEIEQNTAKTHFENKLKTAKNDDEIVQIKNDYEAKTQEIIQNSRNKISETINTKLVEITKNSTETILQKAEQNKQNKVEDDIRARLRGFSRTIPSFLMAYGTKDITLANFDTHINDTVFKEVTGITLDQFRVLRDKHQFFDEQVFDTAAQEFLNKRLALANYFDKNQSEDIFDYIPPQRTNQIFTPKRVVKMMLDKFEDENPDIFNNPDLTFADLYMKSGLYITEIVKRLYAGLKDKIPDENERLKHIFTNQVYGFAPSEIIYHIAKNFILGFDKIDDIDHSHIVHLNTTPYAKGEADFNEKLTEIFGIDNMKFDVMVGNPPYQDEESINNRKTPIYPYFYELAEQFSHQYCLVSPARFLFNAGLTNKQWNTKMLNDEHIKVVHYEDDATKLFPTTDIKGGVAIIHRNNGKIFGKIGHFIKTDEIRALFHRIHQNKFTSFSSIIIGGRADFLMNEKFHSAYPNAKDDLLKAIQEKAKKLSSKNIPTKLAPGSDNEIVTSTLDVLSYAFQKEKPLDSHNYYEVVGVIDNKRVSGWVKKEYLTTRRQNSNNIDFFKVFVPKSMASGKFGETLSEPLVGNRGTTCTPTFLRIGMFNSQLEAEHCVKYIKTKFLRALLGIKKITQDNPVPVWANIPLQDFTANSDIDWTQSIADIDKQLYKKYGLSDDEIEFIETKVKAMI